MKFEIVLTLGRYFFVFSCVATAALIFRWLIPSCSLCSMLHRSQMTSCGERWTGVWNSWNLAWRHRKPLQSRVSVQVNQRSPLWDGLAGVQGQSRRGVLNCALFLLCNASVEEALRAIKTLRNDKAPLVKKRQLMRTMFGDYRKKMEEERCKEMKLMETGRRNFHGEGRGEEEWASLLPSVLLCRVGPNYMRWLNISYCSFAPLFKLRNLPGSWKWREPHATRTASSSGSAQELAGKAKVQRDLLQSHPGHLTQAYSNSQLPKKSFALISCREVF